MLFLILLFIKLFLFINTTDVQYNKLWVFAISALIILFIYSIIYLGKWKNKDRKGLVVYIILSTILLIDVVHFTYFNTLPSVKMLSQVGQVAAVKDSVKSLLTFQNLLMLVDLPIVIFYMVRKKKKPSLGLNQNYKLSYLQSKGTRKEPKWKSIGVPLALVLAIGLSLGYLSYKDQYISVANQEFFLFHARDIKNALRGEKSQATNTDDMRAIIEDAKKRARLKEGKHTGIAKGKNLIVIQVEALQNFVINRDYDGQEITPNINKLLKDSGSIYFDNYYQLVGRGNTSDAEFVTNNSLHPSMEEPSYTQYENNDFYGLPWVLKENGYTPWAFHGFQRDFWNREKAYKKQGFERFIAEDNFDVKEKIGFGITDREFYKQSMDYLKELDSIDDNPFYAFMISLTSHNPFTMPEEYHVLDIRPEHEGTILGDYIQSVHYADETLGEFFQMLKDEGLYEDTVIALYGDHFALNSMDPALNDMMTDFLGYQYDLDEMMRIPMFIHVPGADINETISRAASQMDFFPTILNLLGYDNDKGLVFGRDLLNYEGEHLVAPQAFALKGSFISDELMLVMSRDGLFENSRAYRIDNKEEIKDVSQFRPEHDRVIREINACEYVLKNNLIKDLLEGKDIGTIKEKKRDSKLGEDIITVEANFEDLNKKVSQGYKVLRTELSLDKSFPLEDRARFGNKSFAELAKWMEENPDIILMFRVENPNDIRTTFDNIGKYYAPLRDRMIAEIDNVMYFTNISRRKIDVFLDIRGKDKDMTDEVLLDNINRYDIAYIGMDKERGSTDTPKLLREKQTYTYIYGEDDQARRKALRKNSCEGFVN